VREGIAMSEHSGDRWERIEQLEDPTNFEFKRTPHGKKIHIVGTGLPTSMLVRGGRASGKYGEGAEKALCGVVSQFMDVEDGEIPGPEEGVATEVCYRCNSQAWRIRNKGKFEEVPL